ncbi:MAG: hypothetical protein R3D80_21210 [Paracoccaceae bacterium]
MFAVGDDDQNIYAFSGACPPSITSLKRTTRQSRYTSPTTIAPPATSFLRQTR